MHNHLYTREPLTKEKQVTTISDSLWGKEARLLASRHVASGELIFPPFPKDSPLAAAHAPVELAAEGRVYSFTVIHPSAKSGQAPYAMGYVDLPGPVRIFGRLRGKDRPGIGDRCVVKADDTFGYVFEMNGSGERA
jgi:uncharacterized OB-fold protein